MTDSSIGLSGLLAAQRSIELIGINVANASTDGYHRQEGVLTPIAGGSQSASGGGGGVVMSDVRRIVDRVVEQQILVQQSNMGQVSGGLSALQQVEAAFGPTGSERLGQAMSGFFGAIQQLSATPNDTALQQQVVSSADTLVQEFHSLGQTLDGLDSSLRQQAGDQTDQINTLTDRIASFNGQLSGSISSQTAANVLTDQRDQAISDLSNLISVRAESFADQSGTQQTVMGGDMALVSNTQSRNLECGQGTDGKLGVGIQGTGLYESDIQGGQLGATLELVNTLLPNLRQQLNTLAGQVIQGINQLHVQGVGEGGSFSRLTSSTQGAAALDSWGQGIQEGNFRIRVTDATDKVTCSNVHIDPATDTLAGVAAELNQVGNISASVVNGQLTIAAAKGCKFDFLPALSADPTNAQITGSAAVSVQGAYTGQDNQTYTVTVSGSGQVGIADDLSLEVRDGSGNLVNQVNVGKGYAAGEAVEISDGVSLSLGQGSLNDGDHFSVEALSSSDPTGFLAAAGLNVFFRGTDADSIAVDQGIEANPQSIAVNIAQTLDDAGNLSRLAAVGEASAAGLGNLSPSDYFNQIVTGVGQEVATRQAKQTSIDQITQQLVNQRDTTSGVDINEQSAQLLEFQRLYQAMARFIGVQDTTTQYLINIM